MKVEIACQPLDCSRDEQTAVVAKDSHVVLLPWKRVRSAFIKSRATVSLSFLMPRGLQCQECEIAEQYKLNVVEARISEGGVDPNEVRMEGQFEGRSE